MKRRTRSFHKAFTVEDPINLVITAAEFEETTKVFPSIKQQSRKATIRIVGEGVSVASLAVPPI